MTLSIESERRTPAMHRREVGIGGNSWIYVVVLLLAALSFIDIARWPLHDPDEYKYATAAREMIEGGDWVTPHFNGEPRLIKPILFYWMIAGGYKVFGVHMAVARLCSGAATAIGVFAIWLTARYLLGTTRALLAAVIVTSNIAPLHLSRVATPDATLWACCGLANYAFIRLQFAPAAITPAQWGKWRAAHSNLFFAATALGLLTKGPVALAWCLLPVTVAALLREWRGIRSLRWISGLAILGALIAPWGVLFVARNAAGLRATLLDPGSMQSYAHFSRPVTTLKQFLAAAPQLAGNFLVWLPAIIAAILATLGDRLFPRVSNPPRPERWRQFFALWVFLLVIIYASFYKKSIRYMFPIAGPASILLADALDRMLSRADRRRDNAILVAACGAVCLCIAGGLVDVILHSPRVDTRWFWPEVFVLAAAGLLLSGLRSNPRVQWAMPAVLAGCTFVCMGLLPSALQPLAGGGTQTLAPLVQAALPPGEPLLCYRISPWVLVFEARRIENNCQSFPAFVRKLGGAKACLVSEHDWERVPELQRRPFRIVGRCTVFRSPPVVTPDLSANVEPVLLLVRD